MKRTNLLFLSIIILLYGLSFSAGLHGQADVSPWEKLNPDERPLELKFVENPEAVKKNQYMLWPTWKPDAPTALAAEYLVDLRTVKNKLEAAGIREQVTMEVVTYQGITEEHQRSFKTRRFYRLVAQLGTYTPEIPETGGQSDLQPVVFPIPEPADAYVSVIELRRMKNHRIGNGMSMGVPEIGLLVFRDRSKEVKGQLNVSCYFPFENLRREFVHIESLLLSRKYKKAESYCEELKPELKEKGFLIVADAYFKKGDLEAAARCYERTGENEKKKAFNCIGRVYLAGKNYEKAAEYFEKGELADLRAQSYGKLGDIYRDEGNTPKAKEFYDKAISDYESMIKSIRFTWKDFDNQDRRRCIVERELLKKDKTEIARRERLKKILEGSGKYCRKLFGASFDFICNEEIRERIENAHEGRVTYFYRLTKKGDDVKEERSLIQKGGRRYIRRVPSSNSETYTTERVIFGPNAMVGSGWHNYFDYRIIGEEILDQHKTVIVDVIPKNEPTRNPFFGTVWIDETDYSVLKISWNPKSIEGLQQAFQFLVLERAKQYKGEPHIVSILELNVEKRGLRFPSRLLIEEAYIKENGRKVVRIKRTTDYVDYFFYSVGAKVTGEAMK